MREVDTVVIGAGPGGYETALELGRGGVKTLLIDRSKERIGGTCLHEGCIPAKLYLECAAYASRGAYFKGCGLDVQIGALDPGVLKEKKKALLNELRSGIVWGLDQAGVEFLEGSATFVDAHTLEVSGEMIGFKTCVIATGSVFRGVPNLPLDGKRIISSKEVFEMDRLPASVAILGGGAIGCEMASFFGAFGVEVTLIQRRGRLLPSEDAEVAKALMREFKKQGIRVLTSATLEEATVSDEGVGLRIGGESSEEMRCDILLCATGRSPFTEGLGLEKAGVAVDAKGFIGVNSYLQTSQPHIYALGDCIDTPAYAHTAYFEASIAADTILHGPQRGNTPITPSVVFTHPQIASCGLGEEEAKERGIAVEIHKAWFKVNSKAKIYGDDAGFAKIVTDAHNATVLGASIIGADATEIIHEMVVAVEKKISLQELKSLIHAHPTVSEIVRFL
ncbi:MAG: dihydrolipoyl dehydrogenase [Campylobacterales bacterium]|nr:dihydrolipoyl dehydrogenase [Campylobacterales bacterium]